MGCGSSKSALQAKDYLRYLEVAVETDYILLLQTHVIDMLVINFLLLFL